MAAAEMAKINSEAYTGSVSIPLRPEIRLGYPVYISHIDAFYYVTGITHSFNFGSAATTDLSMVSRRDRTFSDGSIPGTSVGDVLKGYVYRYRENFNSDLNSVELPPEEKIKALDKSLKENYNNDDAKKLLNEIEKLKIQKQNKIIDGPKSLGAYYISKASVKGSDAALKIGSTPDQIQNKVMSNELLMMTSNTVPYTDINGYRHIGAFPYGANLRLSGFNLKVKDFTDPKDKFSAEAEQQTQVLSKESDTAPSAPATQKSTIKSEPEKKDQTVQTPTTVAEQYKTPITLSNAAGYEQSLKNAGISTSEDAANSASVQSGVTRKSKLDLFRSTK